MNVATLLSRIEQLEAENERLLALATTDELTQLPNRRALEDVGEGWFVMCDLAGFKAAQDSHPDGHAYGDRVLQEFADWLRTHIRSTDRIAARFGGDEFAVYCPTAQGAWEISERVLTWLSDDGRVAARAGMGRTVEAADSAMYQSHHSVQTR